MTEQQDAVDRVLKALISGELTRDDLTARRISTFLGQSTMGIYHHFGSLDGFLLRVDGAGWSRLAEALHRRDAEGADFGELAVSYLDFAFAYPHLYWLMAERRFDRDALRKELRLAREQSLWQAFTALVRRHGSKSPVEDTRVLFAGLHGLAVLALSGRANLGDAERSGEALAHESARRLVAAILPPRANGHRT